MRSSLPRRKLRSMLPSQLWWTDLSLWSTGHFSSSALWNATAWMPSGIRMTGIFILNSGLTYRLFVSSPARSVVRAATNLNTPAIRNLRAHRVQFFVKRSATVVTRSGRMCLVTWLKSAVGNCVGSHCPVVVTRVFWLATVAYVLRPAVNHVPLLGANVLIPVIPHAIPESARARLVAKRWKSNASVASELPLSHVRNNRALSVKWQRLFWPPKWRLSS